MIVGMLQLLRETDQKSPIAKPHQHQNVEALQLTISWVCTVSVDAELNELEVE